MGRGCGGVTLRVVVAPPAAFEIADAATAYEATRPGLGRAFLDEVHDAADRIAEFPASCPMVHEPTGVRRVLMHRFPFGMIYRVREDEIQVIAVLPTRADPISSESRIKAAAS